MFLHVAYLKMMDHFLESQKCVQFMFTLYLIVELEMPSVELFYFMF